MQDYIVIGLEERLKYLRRPYKRGQKGRWVVQTSNYPQLRETPSL